MNQSFKSEQSRSKTRKEVDSKALKALETKINHKVAEKLTNVVDKLG